MESLWWILNQIDLYSIIQYSCEYKKVHWIYLGFICRNFVNCIMVSCKSLSVKNSMTLECVIHSTSVCLSLFWLIVQRFGHLKVVISVTDLWLNWLHLCSVFFTDVMFDRVQKKHLPWWVGKSITEEWNVTTVCLHGYLMVLGGKQQL